MCFSGGMAVEGLEVDCSSGCAILFGTDDHAMAPCYWFSNWDGFKNPQSHISVQAGFDGILPVVWVSGVRRDWRLGRSSVS